MTGLAPMTTSQRQLTTHAHDDGHVHADGRSHESAEEALPPTEPSQAVVLDVGEHAGALILTSTADREGLEVEIHPRADPLRRTHVWVLPRRGGEGTTVFAAVFPSLPPGTYSVLEPDGTLSCSVSVTANAVSYATWGALTGEPQPTTRSDDRAITTP